MTTVYIRTGKKGNYLYKDSRGATVNDDELLAYFDRLKIPPSYDDVRIYYQKTGVPKLLYVGIDKAGREQPHYSAEHVAAAERRKFCELLNFAEQVPRITETAREEIKGERQTRNKAIALIIRLMMTCHFRIGNERFYDKYKSIGARNVRKKHVSFATDKSGKPYVYISFPGKKGVINTCHIYDPVLLNEIKSRCKQIDDEDMVFTYMEDGKPLAVTAIEVNEWLKEFDPTITSKHFRTYDANIMLITYLRAAGPPAKKSAAARKRIVNDALYTISERMHNTPAILKKNYAHRDIIAAYLEDPPARFTRYFIDGPQSPQQALIEFLRDYCRHYGADKKKIIARGGGGIH